MRVDEPREDVFTDAALAADQDARLSRRHAGRDGAKMLDCSAAAHQQGIEGMLGSSVASGQWRLRQENTKPPRQWSDQQLHGVLGWEALLTLGVE